MKNENKIHCKLNLHEEASAEKELQSEGCMQLNVFHLRFVKMFFMSDTSQDPFLCGMLEWLFRLLLQGR